jgi:DNA end-binding protein Ku
MPARAIWKATLRLDRLSTAVRMYSAVRERDTHFHLLHATDHVRVREHLLEADTQQVVEADAVQRGYATESGEIVVLEQRDLRALSPKPSREIEILQCAPRDSLPLCAYARPYWLGPDGDAPSYFALSQALEAKAELALCQWVMRGRQHVGALSSRDGALVLHDLHSADEWLDSSQLPKPEGRAANASELKMAEQLLSGLTGEFEHARFHDEQRERVQELIALKARGGKAPRRRVQHAKPATTSLATALSASLRGLKAEKKSA